MQLPRPRFSVRRMMVAVAIVGVVLGVFMRAARLQQVSDYHRSRIILISPPDPRVYTTLYHIQMANKYSDAARHPWLPVTPDPAEPQ
jgi:hypothetical protein